MQSPERGVYVIFSLSPPPSSNNLETVGGGVGMLLGGVEVAERSEVEIRRSKKELFVSDRRREMKVGRVGASSRLPFSSTPPTLQARRHFELARYAVCVWGERSDPPPPEKKSG